MNSAATLTQPQRGAPHSASRLHSRKPWPVPPMALLERETHLSELRQALGDATAGRGRTVLVTGEAGIGKTALVEQFIRGIQSEARVLWGACEALFTPRPLGPFHDIVHALGGPLLARLESDAKPVDLFHALLEAIRIHELPSVMVLEDLHWADHATLDFIRFLTRRIDRTRGMVILTYRDDEIGVDHPLPAVIGELPANSRLRLKLPVLSRATVEQMARASGRATPEIYRITGGNPFFVTEVLREGATNAVSSVREAVLSRARHLPESARELLDLVSVVPDRIELPVLERVVGADLGPLDDCIERGLLGLDDDRVSFRHELARLAIENALSTVKRMRLNARIVQALTEGSGDTPDSNTLTRLSHHAIAARDVNAMVRYGPAAARAATHRGAHREAAALLTAVLPHAAHLPIRERAQFFEQRARAALLVAQGAESLAMSEAAGALWEEQGDDREKASNLVRRCEIIWMVHPPTLEPLRELGTAAIRLLERLGPSDEIELATLWSTLPAALRDADIATARRARALALADRSTDPSTRVTALIGLSMSEYLSFGAPNIANVERLMQEARGAANDQGIMIGHVQQVWRLNRMRDLDALERCVADGQAFAHDRQLDHFVSSHALDLFGAEVAMARGHWEDAEQRFALIAERATLPWFFRIPYCQVPLALLKARRARAYDDASFELPYDGKALLFSIEGYAMHRGLTEIAWLKNDAEQAQRSVAEISRIASDWKHPWALGEAAFWRRVLGVDGDIPDNVAEPYALQFGGDARGAASQWQRRGYVYESALALMLGDDDAQRDALQAFERLGANATAARLRERMTEQGVREIPQGPRATTKSNPAGLTERELEVLQFLARGMSNADIAARLHRSVRTVEHHVAALADKLGADGRQAAVARARERGMLDSD